MKKVELVDSKKIGDTIGREASYKFDFGCIFTLRRCWNIAMEKMMCRRH